MKLTAAGIAFRRHAESVLAQSLRAIVEAKAIGLGQVGSLHVATTSSVLFSGLSLRISGFLALDPDILITIHEMSPSTQLEELKANRIDLSFLRFAPEEPEIIGRKAWKERVGLIVPLDHKLAQRKFVRIAALKNEDFIFYRAHGSAFAAHLYSICVEQGFAPRIKHEVIESFSLHSLVAAGLGIGFVPERLGQLPGIAYLPIVGPAPKADVHVMVNHKSSPLVERFAEYSCNWRMV